MKKSKLNKTSKNTTSQLKRKLQELFNASIVKRGKCVVSGRTDALQCSHFWNEGCYPSVRYDPLNCDCISYPYHYGNQKLGWEYDKQGKYRDFKIAQLGQAGYDALEKRAKKGHIDWHREDLETLIECLKNGEDYETFYWEIIKKRLTWANF